MRPPMPPVCSRDRNVSLHDLLRRCLLPWAALLLLLAAIPAQASVLRVYYPDIEQGSSTLLVSPTGKAMLIDAGSEIRYADDDVVVFVEDLIAAGVISSLDFLVASHYDEDHIGHMEDIMSYDLLAPTGIVYDRGEYHQTPGSFAYYDYSFAATAYTRTTITPGQVIDLGGGVTVTCMVVNGDLSGGGSVDITSSNQFENAASVGLLVEYGTFDLWIAGDLTGNFAEYGVADVESSVGPLVGDVDVYTVHHHGSRTSSTPGFLADLEAEVAINQNSVDNNFGHPNTISVNNFLNTTDSCNQAPLWVQQNRGNPTDSRSDDALADGIADPDDVSGVLGLSGTLLLVSDGTDYQISGGDVAPFTLPNDCAGTATADFPPAILSLTRSPWVPLAAQAVTVEADVRDEGSPTTRPTVTLEWSVDGVAQTAIAMAAVGGTNLYQGTLPAQADGARVAYAVSASDSSASAVSRPQGYFSGTSPVAALRLNDAEGILIPVEYAARIEGNVTVEPGVFHPFVSQIFVQDDAGDGLQIFDNTLLPLDRGDRVELVGELEQFSGQTELNTAQDFGGYGVTDLGPGSVPAPQVITVAQAGEGHEGRLVRIDGVTLLSGTIPGPGEGNGYLTISDDGGTSTLTLKIDQDTQIPGSGTPTQAFDVIGVISQFDAWPTLDDGYEIVPREPADLVSPEVNLPAVLIHEIHADPENGTPGDANGDGTRSATADEFIELANPSWQAVDVSGWTLADGGEVRHTFASGTVIPPREALVVFGGGSPTGDFGNAAANGLVFTADAGTLSLNNSGDTVTLADDLGAIVQQVTYGSEGGGGESLTRSPDLSNSPLADHTAVASGGERFSPGTWAEDGLAFTIALGDVVLSEVLYDADGPDGGFEWVELVNLTDHDLDLAKRPVSLGWGGNDYTGGGLTLDSGVISPCSPFVVGGPGSDATNGSPTFDLVEDFSPDFQNSGSTADGVALFNRPAAYVTASTAPADAVIYGTTNSNCLLDESGACGTPDVGDVSGGGSAERTDTAGSWQTQSSPTPGTSPLTTGGTCGGGNNGGGGTCLDASTLGTGDLVLSEVLYDVTSGDNGWEWVELYNASSEDVCLDGLSLGWAGSDYTYGSLELTGTVPSGATWVVGGLTSGANNGNPGFDQAVDLSPDLQNSGSTADGVALFLDVSANVGASTVPYDAVVYGSSNPSCLLDESGACATPDVGDAAANSSIERTTLSGLWQTQSSPTPGSSPLP